MKNRIEITSILEGNRIAVKKTSSRKLRGEIGQFITPPPIAFFMASLFERPHKHVRILDAGAGTGVLFTSLVHRLCSRHDSPATIEVVAYESDTALLPHLEEMMKICGRLCKEADILFKGEAISKDFIVEAAEEIEGGLFGGNGKRFTHAILNPPYKKINGDTLARKTLSSVGIETSNLYSAFVWLSVRLLEPSGEIVAITPRSFCNGPYFYRYRKSLLDLISLRHVHLFESRKDAFADDEVLQENVIFYGVRGEPSPEKLKLTISKGRDIDKAIFREMLFESVILPGDGDSFIHLFEDDEAKSVMDRMSFFDVSLEDLGLQVSTGRVVDFRAREFIRKVPDRGTVPLIFPCHFYNGFVRWPALNGKKHNAIYLSEKTKSLMVKQGYYVLAKRFSAKEERRRIVAAVYDPNRIEARFIGFENHLNYFHENGEGLSANLAKGLAVFLNSTLLDRYFRLFSGHTQVNASDLRKIRYPSRIQLENLGRMIDDFLPDQGMIDAIVEKECGIYGREESVV